MNSNSGLSTEPRILVVDNYDSFTYNLVHLLQECGKDCTVIRNDKFELSEVEQYDKILLSPGPGIPREAGLLMDVIRTYGAHKSILGICLGQQAIAEVYGGALFNLKDPFHGIATPMQVSTPDEPLFSGLPERFQVGRYHSWAVSPESLPSALEVTGLDDEGVIMSLRHREYDVKGFQFHPESVLSEYGRQLISNWLSN